MCKMYLSDFFVYLKCAMGNLEFDQATRVNSEKGMVYIAKQRFINGKIISYR